MPVDPAGTVLLLVDVATVTTVLLWPVLRPPLEDSGDGRRHVGLPRPRPVSPLRTASLFAIFFCLSIVYTGFANRAVDRLYADAVGRLAGLMIRDPAAIAQRLGAPSLGLRFLILGYLVSFAVVLRAGPVRRLTCGAHAVLYLVIVLSADAFLVAFSALFNLALQPFGLVGNVVAILLGALVMMRMIFSTFALPRTTTLPRRVVAHLESVQLAALLVIVLCAITAVDVYLAPRQTTELRLLTVGVIGYAALLPLAYSLLLVLTLRRRPSADPAARTRVDVIIPAWNEQVIIASTLASIDRAARPCAGPVHVIVADDGSTDATRRVAAAAIAGFAHASGEIVLGGHRGKAAALNVALARSTSDIVVRIDADTVIHEDALLHALPWFSDPSVGQVSALTFPRQDGGWLHQMRALETAYAFGFQRRAIQLVDGISVVPGTFTAFRRSVAVEVGGFTEGMNGEDLDLTLQFGRLGYRVVMDPRVRITEDVPTPLSAFREQRTRWNRGTIQCLARHLNAGWTGPRLWYGLVFRGMSARVSGALRPLLLIHLVHLAIFFPSARLSLAALLVAYVVVSLAQLLVLAALAVAYRRWRALGMLPLWYFFVLMRRIFVIEAMLTLPARPVRLRLRAARGRTEPVSTAPAPAR